MTDAAKTGLFVGVAAALAGIAALNHYAGAPANSDDFQLVGLPFYEEFTSSSQAKSLEVIARNEDGVLQKFSVVSKDGLWTIPSHYDYPAEAIERLARTASSLIGLEREALAGRLKTEHDRLGVRDPLDDELEDPETAGQRITLKDVSGETVVDLIIGNKVENDTGLNQSDDVERMRSEPVKSFYVRRQDENQTYKVAVNIDLSTKFSDWIDPDLLQIERSDLKQISVDNYSLEETRTAAGMALVKSQGDQIELAKDPSGSWKLDGLDENTETLENAKINEVIGVLDQMKITGVRPKFTFKGHQLLTADLQLNQRPEFQEDKRAFALAIREMQADLENKGFSLAGGANGGMALVSVNGDLTVGTNDGVRYIMNIGEAIEGSTEEIEVGGANATSTDDAAEQDDADSPETPEDNGNDSTSQDVSEDRGMSNADAKNRYLMVRVAFDESLIDNRPEKPIPPVEPLKPDGYQPATDDENQPAPDDVDAPPVVNENETNEPDQSSEQPADQTQEPNEAKADPETPQRKPEFVAYETALKDFAQKQAEFTFAETQYQESLKAFEKEVEAGKQRVAELNERFGKWYYVISADNLKTLQLNRDVIVKRKEVRTDPTTPNRPNISFPDIPGMEGLNPRKGPLDQSEPRNDADSGQEKSAAGDKTDESNPSAEPKMEKPEGGKDQPNDASKETSQKPSDKPNSSDDSNNDPSGSKDNKNVEPPVEKESGGTPENSKTDSKEESGKPAGEAKTTPNRESST
ncbi:MAG: DUF4340 domain-containing protein [Planctomycetota bacterium]